jgi:flagellar basal body-associated protein FliL
MRKIAVILLLIFSFVQAGPGIAAVFSHSSISLFMVDEEKEDDKSGTDKKEIKKVVLTNQFQLNGLARLALTAIHRSEKIHPSPCIEKTSPPPNFC